MFIDTIDLNCNRPIRLNLTMKSKILYIESFGPMLSKIIYENKESLKVPIGAERLEELFNEYDPQSSVSFASDKFSPRNILDSQSISPRSTKPIEEHPNRKHKKHNEES